MGLSAKGKSPPRRLPIASGWFGDASRAARVIKSSSAPSATSGEAVHSGGGIRTRDLRVMRVIYEVISGL